MFVIVVSSFLVSEQIVVHVSKVNKLNKKTSGDEKTKKCKCSIYQSRLREEEIAVKGSYGDA